MIKPFVQEHFEGWLFSQPDNREFNFYSPYNCVMGKYFLETGRTTWEGLSMMSHYLGVPSLVPRWLALMLREISEHNFLYKAQKMREGQQVTNCNQLPIFAGQVKERYARMFPGMRRYFYTEMQAPPTTISFTMNEALTQFSAPGVLCGSATE